MTSISAAYFDAIGDTYDFPAFAGTKDDINNLEAEDVVAFMTVDGKYGLIKVNGINQKGDIINIDVIVEN